MGRTGRKPKVARIWMRPDDDRWLILDRGKQYATGVRGADCENDAQVALERYLAAKHFDIPVTPQPPALVPIDLVLNHYLRNRREDMAAPQRQAYAVLALMKFWTKKYCTDVNEMSCRQYARTRQAASTARRELGVLSAALRKAHADGVIQAAPPVWLPPKSKAKPDWLTRT